MKTKDEILKMSNRELADYQQSKEIEESFNIKENSCCSDCSDCFGCSDCSDCSDCWKAKGLKYAICNIEMNKEQYEAKIEELQKSVKLNKY